MPRPDAVGALCVSQARGQAAVSPALAVDVEMCDGLHFFRSLKEECVWQHDYAGFVEARSAISQWIRWHNGRRPHQALGYLSRISTGLNNYRRGLEMGGALQHIPTEPSSGLAVAPRPVVEDALGR
jgi:hypothetical protein